MTNYGFCGPMTDMSTAFDPKAAGSSFTPRLMLMGVGCWLLWILAQ